MDFLTPELVGTIISGLLAIILYFIQRFTGVKIEEKHKRDLHDALMSGAMAAVTHGPSAGIDVLKLQAIRHAQHSVPGALKALIPGDTVLDTIAARYVSEAFARLNARHGEPH
ncbi:hypothetical protein [Acidiphilium sp.]|uniref:hypothetical protein n=1 Tax=Acidiphilium sp. TaxID=527 RepID=UPI00258EA8C4|nr:hypothetical protein [Acidiphilium sp.]